MEATPPVDGTPPSDSYANSRPAGERLLSHNLVKNQDRQKIKRDLKHFCLLEIKSQWWFYFSTPDLHLYFGGLIPDDRN